MEEKCGVLIRRLTEELREQYPYFATILRLLKWRETEEEIELATDGGHIYYHRRILTEHYRRDRYKTLKRQLLHILCHGLLGHLELEERYGDKALVGAVLDMQAARLEGNLTGGGELLRKSVSEVYYKAKSDAEFRRKLLKNWYRYYRSDDHGFWRPEEVKAEGGAGDGAFREEVRQMWEICRSQVLQGADAGSVEGKELQEAFRERSGPGLKGGGESWLYENEKRDGMADFRDLLRSLWRPREVVRELPETYETALYLYGLELYGDVPLIEPLESGEGEKLDTLVIAIDTSGSCVDSGGIFLAETGGIVRELGSMGGFARIYVISCDSHIRQEACFETIETFEDFAGKHRLKGGGGTSFVPVFLRAEELKKAGEEISAVLYFSDGVGEFPEKAPDYPVYFIMCRKPDRIRLPEWVNVIVTGGAGQQKGV